MSGANALVNGLNGEVKEGSDDNTAKLSSMGQGPSRG